MSEELLEPFRKAAELGCKWFSAYTAWRTNNVVEFRYRGSFELPTTHEETNQVAAAVCAEWWHERYMAGSVRLQRWGSGPVEEYAKLVKDTGECPRMIDLCRAFGQKHGGTQ